jgi:hypothetical protein
MYVKKSRFRWYISFGLILIGLFGCNNNDFENYNSLIVGTWIGTESIEGVKDTVSILNYKFENPNKVALILEKKNLAKASGVDTISLNTGTYILTDNQLTATTMYVSNTKALESKLNAEISFLTSDSMVLRTVDGLKRTIISTFSKVQ